MTDTPNNAADAQTVGARSRPYPDLLSQTEQQALLARAERLWKELQENDLGGFSGINRPFWILYELKAVIEEFGRRDVGLRWSKNDLESAKARSQSMTDPLPEASAVPAGGGEKLYAIARAFIDKHQISCAEATAEDGVYEEAPLLVEQLAEVVGYYQYSEDAS